MAFEKFTTYDTPLDRSTLKVDRHAKHISAKVEIISFIDDDTKQHVVYMPGLGVSGYGETNEKAVEMLRFSADQLFSYLMGLTEAQMLRELRSLGWMRNRYFQKEFSAAHVDEDGVLQGFNAQEGSVRRSALVAA